MLGVQKESVMKSEIEREIARVGDYVKVDILRRYLTKNLDMDTRRYVIVTLAKCYEQINMFGEAGKLIAKLSESAMDNAQQQKYLIQAGKLFVQGGIFDQAGIVFRKAVAVVQNELMKQTAKMEEKNAYLDYAKVCLAKHRRAQAVKAYEELVSLDITPAEKTKFQTELIGLYESTGRVGDYYSLKRRSEQTAY